MPGHIRANGAYASDNFMSWHHRIPGPSPFIARRVDIAMADTTPGDLDQNVIRLKVTPVNFERFDRCFRSLSGIGSNAHRLLPVMIWSIVAVRQPEVETATRPS